jgi:hypothetical protein
MFLSSPLVPFPFLPRRATQVLAQGSGSSVDWLVEKFGLDLSIVSMLGAPDLAFVLRTQQLTEKHPVWMDILLA